MKNEWTKPYFGIQHMTAGPFTFTVSDYGSFAFLRVTIKGHLEPILIRKYKSAAFARDAALNLRFFDLFGEQE